MTAVDLTRPDEILYADQHEALCRGNYYEPRAWYDMLTLEAAGDSAGGDHGFFDAQTFVNTEGWVTHLTHLTWIVRQRDAETTDPTLLQRVGQRLIWHDAYYMTDTLAPIPLWENVRAALAAPFDEALAVWNFIRPILLPHRGALAAYGSLETALGAGITRNLAVGFHGKGNVTKQPRELATERALGPAIDQDLRLGPSEDLANDGSEPIVIESMTLDVKTASNARSDPGDSRAARVRLRMDGGGTGVDFTKRSTVPPPVKGCPVALLGPDGGRALVHRIPRGGWIMHPGRGFLGELRNFHDEQIEVCMAALGYVVVP